MDVRNPRGKGTRLSQTRGLDPVSAAMTFQLPAGATDCHVHIFEPDLFPYSARRSYTPAVATVADLVAFRAQLGIDRVVLVQPSVYEDDNRGLLRGLAELGPLAARGIAVIDPAAVSDEELASLKGAGVVGVRVNLHTGGDDRGAAAVSAVEATIARVSDHGLAVQIYVELALVERLAATIAASPVPVILDHFGGAKAAHGLGQPGFSTLLRLLEGGNTWVKLSGIYRTSDASPDYEDVAGITRALVRANPDRLVWASDWPHTGGGADRKARKPSEIEPFRLVDNVHLLARLREWIGDDAILQNILVGNAAKIFRF